MDRKDSLLKFLEKDPKADFLLFALAKEYEYTQNTILAIETYQKLLHWHPHYTGAFYHLGKQLELNNQSEAAINIYLSGIEICNKLKAFHDASELRSALDQLDPTGVYED